MLDFCNFSSLVTNLLYVREIWKDGLKKPLPSSWDEGSENGVWQHLWWVKRNPARGRGELCLPHQEELTTIDFTEMTVTVKSSLYLSTVPADERSSAFVHAWLPSVCHSTPSLQAQPFSWLCQMVCRTGPHCSCNAVSLCCNCIFCIRKAT